MSVTFLCGSQYKTHCTTTSIRTSKTAKKNYCKFSEVIPKKIIYLLSISCSMVLRSQPCSYAVQIRCVTSMISNFVYKPNMAFVWLSEIWELQPDFFFFFFAHFFTESHCMTSEDLEYCLCVSWTLLWCIDCFVKHPSLLKSFGVQTERKSYGFGAIWGWFKWFSFLSEPFLLCLCNNTWRLSVFILQMCYIRFLISAVLIRSEFTLDPGV